VLAVAGAWCVVAGWDGLDMIAGLLLLALAVVLGPRFRGLPDDRPVLFRADAPELFALIDEIAGVVGTRGVRAIVVDENVNAGAAARADELWDVLTTYTTSVPEYEYERQRRAGARRGHRVDTIHPPTHLRRTCLLGGPHLEAALTPDLDRELRIAKELATARAEVARRILRHGVGDYAVHSCAVRLDCLITQLSSVGDCHTWISSASVG
jgi:hypothetical protein